MSEPSTERPAERVADQLLARFAAQVRPWLVRELGQVLNPLNGPEGTDEPDEIETKAAAWVGKYQTRHRERRRGGRTDPSVRNQAG